MFISNRTDHSNVPFIQGKVTAGMCALNILSWGLEPPLVKSLSTQEQLSSFLRLWQSLLLVCQLSYCPYLLLGAFILCAHKIYFWGELFAFITRQIMLCCRYFQTYSQRRNKSNTPERRFTFKLICFPQNFVVQFCSKVFCGQSLPADFVSITMRGVHVFCLREEK